MNPRTTWTLLTVAAAMFAWIWFFERHVPASGELSEPEPLLAGFDAAQVNAIEVRYTNFTVRLHRDGDRWQLTHPPANARSVAVNAFLTNLQSLRIFREMPIAELARDAGSLELAGFTPPRAELRIEQGTNQYVLRVGLPALAGSQLYVQGADTNLIQLTQADLLDHLPRSAFAWRDPQIADLRHQPFDTIQIRRGNQLVELRRGESNRWSLSKPLPAPADSRRIEALIAEIAAAQAAAFLPEPAVSELPKFGLSPAETELILVQGTNAILRLDMGISAGENGEYVYARKNNAGALIILPRALPDLVRQPSDEFRERRLLTFEPGHIRRIEATAAEPFVLQGTNDQWRIIAPFEADADPELVRDFFTRLAQLEIAEFKQDVVTDYAEYGLAKPRWQYQLFTTPDGGTNGLAASAAFSTPQVDRVFARRLGSIAVYVVPAGDILQLPQAAFALRDRKFCPLDPSEVTRITVKHRGHTREIEKARADRWHELEVENAELEEVVYRLTHATALRWITKGSSLLDQLKFDEASFEITLHTGTDDQAGDFTFRFGGLAPGGDVFGAAVLDQGEPVVFTFSGPRYAEIFRILHIPAALN